MKKIFRILLGIGSLLCAIYADESRNFVGEGGGSGPASLHSIDLAAAKRRYDAHSALFVDARRFERYRQGTIMRAINLPLHRFKRMLKWLPRDKKAPLLVFGDGPQSNASLRLVKRLAQAGYSRVLLYRGGYSEWRRHRLPVMGAPRPCSSRRLAAKSKKVDGVSIYVDSKDDSHIDANWIAPMLEAGRVPRGLHLVDVRPSSRYAAGHLQGAVNVPFDPERQKLDLSALPKKGPILLTCRHGSLSTDAWFSLPQSLQQRTFVLDASVECEKDHCTVHPN